MVHELFYTSAERGLELGTSGFCTVARTRGLPKRLERLLHGLSVYKWDLRSGHNPVVYMYTRANLDGQSLFIVSRVAPAPADYSGRSNYFAHHVVLTASELPQAGPVWLMRQPGFLEQQWDGQVPAVSSGQCSTATLYHLGTCHRRRWLGRTAAQICLGESNGSGLPDRR